MTASQQDIGREQLRRIGGAVRRLRTERRLSLRRLADALAACAEVDQAIKGAASDDPWLLLRRLALSLAG